MPTENRSSNTEMVSVPRDLVARVSSADIGMSAKKDRHQAAFELRTRLASSPSQPHPEPIAWMVGTAFWWTREEAERDAAAIGLPVVGLGPMTGSAPAEQHQGDAIGTLVRDYNERIVFTPIGDPHIIDDMKVYAHADPGEVERLRAQVDTLAEWCGNALNKLADRDALLREALPAVEYESGRGDAAGTSYLQLADKIKSLSASAEPSAPVEIDERHKGCCCPPKGYNGVWAAGPCPVHQGLRKLGQARAALDRKPS